MNRMLTVSEPVRNFLEPRQNSFVRVDFAGMGHVKEES
jgi:hypothetical protein